MHDAPRGVPPLDDVLLTFTNTFGAADTDVRRAHRERARAAGMPTLEPHEGAFLSLLARLVGAARVLEIGTFAGDGTAWLASGAPTARLVTYDAGTPAAPLAAELWRVEGVDGRIVARPGFEPGDPGVPDELFAPLRAHEVRPSLRSFDLVVARALHDPLGTRVRALAAMLPVGGLLVVLGLYHGGGVVDDPTRGGAAAGMRAISAWAKKWPTLEVAMLPVADGTLLVRRDAPEPPSPEPHR